MADTPGDTSASDRAPDGTAPSAGEIAELYLGNILYALERCAMSLDSEEKALDAAFYRGIGRRLADAHGRSAASHRRSPGEPT